MKRAMFLSSLCLFLLSAPLVYAVDAHTINLAGKQRMLTQKMSKEVFLIASGIAPEKNLENLQKTHDLFGKTLAGLRYGDAELSLTPIKNRRIHTLLTEVDTLWRDFSPAIKAVITTGNVSQTTLKTVATGNMPLLKTMNRTVKLYEAEAAASTNIGQAVSVNLAGRQRMLSQKMAKEFLLIGLDYHISQTQKALKKTHDTFDQTLAGLMDGNGALGLSAAPPAIRTQLDVVKALWQEFKAPILRATTTQTLSDDDKQQIAAQNLPLLKEMNKAVTLFTDL